MNNKHLLRVSASVMAASVALAASPAVAIPREALIDGNGGAGYVITDVVQNGASNPNVMNSTPLGALVVVPLQGAAAASAGKSLTVGADDTNTIFSNFAARGGDGSGAGAGLGGVFFVDDSHTLTLVNNVNLNGLAGRIAVYDNLTSDNDWAVMAGQRVANTLIIDQSGDSLY